MSKRYFFIGIGGIGMSAIARYFLAKGEQVGGYDRIRSKVSSGLEEAGAEILYEDTPELIPSGFQAPNEVVVVYTPAIHMDNRIRQYYAQHGYEQIKRAVVLGEITRMQEALCVAGTHGKTTTSTLLAHLLEQSHIGTNAFLGGVSQNTGSNLYLHEESPYVVIEADEYDRSFHQLTPTHTIITSTEPDHLDVYGTAEAYREAFQIFAEKTKDNGLILLNEEATLQPLRPQLQLRTYGKSAECDYYYSNIHYEEDQLYFDWHYPGGCYSRLLIGTPIEINVLNATAALALAQHLGATEEELRTGLASFLGSRRRFERWLNEPNHPIMIDDYAHHPDEIRASLSSIRRLYPDKEIAVVFQPHLYSRTADFLREFASALSIVDNVIMIPIYPAREEPIPGVTSEAVLRYVTAPRKACVPKAELVDELKKHRFDILVMMGAGDIEYLLPEVRDYLQTIEL
ncbi:UDP-N-acetylmuramate--L-alanine ligase [Porphyromonas levii]|uniref:UDP-N-acetylmuramate--L-alanine ligase n=1 Tax=Porphyromonas levii TaxID=28114 RepID=UPI001B8C8D97|nr:UDP-N-acetylmuramate--L-alanine ligase [Porphyromonas levii]MBR8712184.1 UDP-N-acetylmuramate--L-alanine ligase [Porphyromonas levii]MBR8714350.1 UDP-N-acetylmuramate--L-alanine ligase [Porphyromonas levii]MBR8726891.1 UDP-N-acetylmuramate--L-alanine ligase [Porphyromonas levii]MBR8728716.1 UDP-N-acetylmuramate--L-alanine ligase [Porphyromonas levii]MBR8735198.1 UDP-N-acetylmuramate--L-alanine ligase [Porphyromonas levii]